MYQKLVDGFKKSPVQNVAIILIIISVVFLGIKVTDNSGADKIASNVVFLGGNPDNYFIPQVSDSSTQSGGVASSIKKLAASAASSISSKGSANKYNLTLASSLYQFNSSAVLNAKAGIRRGGSLSKKSFLKAYAAGDYPAVYYIALTKSLNTIVEMNTLTAAKQTIIEENNSIGALDFNQKNQSIVYAVKNKEYNSNGWKVTYDVKIYNLANKQTTVIKADTFAKDGVINPRWSPDGEYVAFANVQSYDAQSNIPDVRVSVYKLSTKELKDYAVPADKIWSETGYSLWSDDGTKLLFSSFKGTLQGATPQSNNAIAVMDRDSGAFSLIEDNLNTYDRLQKPVLIKDKIFGITLNPDDWYTKNVGATSEVQQRYPSQYGWLSVFNASDKSFTEFRTQTDEFVDRWIVNSNANKIVFSTSEHGSVNTNIKMKLKVIDVNSGVAKELSCPSNYNFVLIGWNGNEENVLLWDQTSIFYNVNISSGEMTMITGPH